MSALTKRECGCEVARPVSKDGEVIYCVGAVVRWCKPHAWLMTRELCPEHGTTKWRCYVIMSTCPPGLMGQRENKR